MLQNPLFACAELFCGVINVVAEIYIAECGAVVKISDNEYAEVSESVLACRRDNLLKTAAQAELHRPSADNFRVNADEIC